MNSEYFWSLDSSLPGDVLREYQLALEDAPESRLKMWVRLLQANVPILPRAYLTSSFAKVISKTIPPTFYEELGEAVSRFETQLGAHFGGEDRPLLLSVQGDYGGTVRNIGVTLRALRGLIHDYGPGPAYSLFVDFLESYSTFVLGCPHVDFRKTFSIKSQREGGAGGLAELSLEQFSSLVTQYQNLVSQKVQKPFQEGVERQLLSALVQCTSIGNLAGRDEVFIVAQRYPTGLGRSIEGVAFTRNPFSGDRELYGVYKNPRNKKKHPLEPEGQKVRSEEDRATLRETHPDIYGHIKKCLPFVERCFKDVIECDFVVDDDGHLYFSDFNKAQTTARASAVGALELCHLGVISDREAALRIKPGDVEVLLHPTLDDRSRSELHDLGSTGTTAAPGTAVGHVFFKMNDALDFYRTAAKAKRDKRIILIAEELLISDTPGIGILSGLVTKASGIASHAAVMARANGIPCIVGYKDLDLDPKGRSMKVGANVVDAGTIITLEAGTTARLYLGEGRLQNLSFQEGIVRDIAQLMNRTLKEADAPLRVYANINNSKEVETAVSFGAEGVGLCRTENMFIEKKALQHVRNIVFAQDAERARQSLLALEETQYTDYRKIFEALGGRRINIRLMDLPLHEFAPHNDEEFESLHRELNHLDKELLRATVDDLREHNPMLGLRACRFGLLRPEVYDMQIRAIVRAAYHSGVPVDPGIMFPLIVVEEELKRLRMRTNEIEASIREELKVPFGKKIHFRVGTMVEVPACALRADDLARISEFFAFGTNDLTQTTLGMSRDDSAHYLPAYLEKGILAHDPFRVLSVPVQELLETAVHRGRRVRRDASFGICGEQSGDRATLEFCLGTGIDYVSCSPFRVLPVRTLLVHVMLSFGSQTFKGSPPSATRQLRANA